MHTFGSSLGRLIRTAAVATSITLAAPAGAATIQLGFILDSSGSIGSTDWSTIVNGLATAVNSSIPIGGSDTYEVSVVTFSSTATTPIQNVLVNSVAARTALAASIAALPFLGGGTNFAPAFAAMQNALDNTTLGNTSLSYVNFATDGVESDPVAGVAARNALIAAGVDNISIEGIGGGVDVAGLTGSYCHPGPCDTTAPYNFPAQGFYIGVANAAAYASAIGNKIRVVTGTVPEPASLALLGLALAGLGFSSRKRV